MTAYAAGTDVPAARSIAELDGLVTKYGATGFAYGRDNEAGMPVTRVMFRLKGRTMRFEVRRPNPQDYRRTPTGRVREPDVAAKEAEAEERRRWRELVLLVKAMLVATQTGVVDLHQAFLPYTVLPDQSTVHDWAEPQLAAVYETNTMPQLLPGGAS